MVGAEAPFTPRGDRTQGHTRSLAGRGALGGEGKPPEQMHSAPEALWPWVRFCARPTRHSVVSGLACVTCTSPLGFDEGRDFGSDCLPLLDQPLRFPEDSSLVGIIIISEAGKKGI